MNFTGGVWQPVGKLLCAAALLWMIAPALSAAESIAQEREPAKLEIAKVVVGIAGNYKVGHWTPVNVTLATHKARVKGRLILTVSDDEGLSTRYVDDEVLSLSDDKTVERYVRFGNRRPELTVEFVQDDGAVARRNFTAAELPTAFTSTSELVVIVGNEIGVAGALPNRTYRQKRETHVVKVASVAELPRHSLGFDGIDLLSIATSEMNTKTPVKSWRNVSDWLLLGGRAVISCGRQSEVMFGQGGLLAALAPGEFERVGSLRRTAALEAYAGSVQRLVSDGALDIAQFRQPRGRLEAIETSGAEQSPLILHYPVGFGQVSLVTIDLDQAPLVDWPGRVKLMGRVLAFHQPGETGRGEERQNLPPAQLGYHDLSGQLRNALDQFSGVRLVAFSLVAALIAVYILLIGPGDYFLVRFGLRRMQATWLTLSLMSLAFLALAWWLDARLKSSQVVINQANIIDLDAETGVVRGRSWMHLYSPRTSTYALTPTTKSLTDAATGPLRHPATVVAWQGLAGDGLGGLDGRQAPRLFDLPYEIVVSLDSGETRSQVERVPVQTASTKGFTTNIWTNGAPLDRMKLEVSSDGILTGKFDWPLDLELTDTIIYHDRFLYRISGVVKPGRTLELTPTSTARDMRFHLTQKRVIDSKEIVTPWNPRSTDIPRILEVMMLHEAAGGDSYTGLTARYDERIDLSDHLATGRALLVGKAKRSPISWGDEQLQSAVDHATTLVRIVIPVTAADR